MIRVKVQYYEGDTVMTLIEEQVPRHSQRIEPPVAEVFEFDSLADAKSWVLENPRLQVVDSETIPREDNE